MSVTLQKCFRSQPFTINMIYRLVTITTRGKNVDSMTMRGLGATHSG